MTDTSGVAAVTRILTAVLLRAKPAALPHIEITTRAPAEPAATSNSTPRINVFLYRVQVNAAWRNEDVVVPTGDPPRRYHRRVLPLDLHYLLSFHGDEDALVPHRLLGAALVALEENCRLGPAEVRAVFGADSASPLASVGLAEDVAGLQPIRLSMLQLDLEEMSKLWGLFPSVNYGLSVAYQASAVLLEHGAPLGIPLVRQVDIAPPQPDPTRRP